MGMDVVLVHMGGDENLEAGKLFRSKPNGELMSRLRCDPLLRREGLNEMIEHSAVCFSVLQLCVHHLTVGGRGHAVDACHKLSVSMLRLGVPFAVGEYERKACSRL